MRLLLAILLAFAASACDKTIHECRLEQGPQAGVLTAVASASTPAAAGD